jgi:hypothetical protein
MKNEKARPTETEEGAWGIDLLTPLESKKQKLINTCIYWD